MFGRTGESFTNIGRLRGCARARNDGGERCTVRAELDSSRANVGTADVQLERADDVAVVEMSNHFGEFLSPATDDIHDHACTLYMFGEPWQFIAPDRVDAGIRESNRVEHAAMEFRDARR